MQPESRRIILEAIIIVALGAMIGLSVNYRLVIEIFSAPPTDPSPTGESRSPAAWPVPVDLEEARELLLRDGLAVDARAAEMYAEGHIPDAYSLPLGEAEKEISIFRKEIPFDRPLVIYCSGYGCSDSFDLAVRLIREGYRDVRVFEGGFPAWREAGLSVMEGVK